MTSPHLIASALLLAGDVRAGYIPGDLKVAQILLVIAAGLSMSRLPDAELKRASLAFCCGIILGVILLILFGQPHYLSTLVIVFAVVLGVLTALQFGANGATGSMVISLTGMALAAASTPANGEYPQMLSLMAINLIAGAGAIICLSRLVSILTPKRARSWQSVAVRIAGSWIVAVSVLIIAVSSQTYLF